MSGVRPTVAHPGRTVTPPTGSIHSGPTNGFAQPMHVEHPDNRQANNGTLVGFPNNAMVQILWFNNSNNQFVTGCSGSIFKSPRFGAPSLQVLTAGHCVYNSPSHQEKGVPTGWYHNFAHATVYIGDNPGSKPYGTCSEFASGTFNNWINSGDWNYDFGIMRIGCPNNPYFSNNNAPSVLGADPQNNNATFYDSQPVWTDIYWQTDRWNQYQQVFSPGIWQYGDPFDPTEIYNDGYLAVTWVCARC